MSPRQGSWAETKKSRAIKKKLAQNGTKRRTETQKAIFMNLMKVHNTKGLAAARCVDGGALTTEEDYSYTTLDHQSSGSGHREWAVRSHNSEYVGNTQHFFRLRQ